jgi:HEAT repeat protein
MHYCVQAKVDAPAIYRAELDNPSASVHRTRCALLGLAALGDKTALPAIRARLNSEFPRIRLAALAALAGSPPGQFEELCLHSLLDSSSAVVRTARHFLLRASTPVGTAKLMELVSQPVADGTYRACLMLATRASKWDHLAFLLRLNQHVEKDSARWDDLIAALWCWDSAFNRTQVVVTPSQLSQLSASLSAAKPSIPEPLAERIAFTLRVAKR